MKVILSGAALGVALGVALGLVVPIPRVFYRLWGAPRPAVVSVGARVSTAQPKTLAPAEAAQAPSASTPGGPPARAALPMTTTDAPREPPHVPAAAAAPVRPPSGEGAAPLRSRGREPTDLLPY